MAEGRGSRWVWGFGVALIAGFYLVVITGGDFRLFRPEPGDVLFPNMLQHLLHGRFDVDPAAIGDEAFLRNGRSYAYFGVFPALLRLPVMAFADLRETHLAAASCWLAMVVGACAQVSALRAALSRTAPSKGRRAVLAVLLLTAVFSGPAVLLGRRANLYDESMLWAWAQAMVFIALALHGMLRRQGFSTGLRVGMAIMAGLCLLTRPTTALGLYAAFGLLLLHGLVQPTAAAAPLRLRAVRRLGEARFWLPVAAAAGFVIIAGAINQARWGNPLIVADLHAQLFQLARHPDRLPRLDRYGLFNVRRIGLGLLYYLFPVWVFRWHGSLLFQSSIDRMFDAFELPPSSLLLTDPLTILFAVAGLLLPRRSCPAELRNPGRLLLAGLAIPPVMMLMAWYMAFRYRAEFAPVLVAAAYRAAPGVAASLDVAGNRRLPLLLLGLCLMQIASAQLEGEIYYYSPLGPRSDYESVGAPSHDVIVAVP